MERKQGTPARNRNVFKGALLISLLVETHPRHFPSRSVACKLGRRLLREGYIKSISGAKDFQDSAQLYMWHEQDLAIATHGRDMTSTASSSFSNPNSSSKSDSRSHRQLDWQLILDIRNKLLNRSEAYNIVTSYNTFIKELEHDFGYDQSQGLPKKSPIGGSDVGWSGTNAPHTSTLEHKKEAVYSTDSSLDTQKFSGKFKNGGKHRKRQSKHNSHGQHANKSPLKINFPMISQPTSSHINQEQNKTNSHHQSNQTAPEMNKEAARNLVIPEEQLSESNFNSQQANSSPNNPTVMKIRNSTNHPSHNQQTRVETENHGNDVGRNIDSDNAVVSGRVISWPQETLNQHLQSVPAEMQTWLDPRSSQIRGKQQWISENNIRTDRAVLTGESRSRWPESVVNDGTDSGQRWPENMTSYSDNEKQLLEEMRRMKKEHQNVLRTYESRINKLMAKMHELRNIAEMLEHSSNKSSPYGDLSGKLALLSILGGKSVDGKKVVPESSGSGDQVPPPLPPRPGRGSRVYPNKPIIHTAVRMRPLPWSRIILDNNETGEQAATVWHGMTEPKIDTEELQRLFSGLSEFPNEVNLYDDICMRRGRNQVQTVSIYDAERSQRIISELRALHCTLPDIIQAFLTLNCDSLHNDSFAELLELLASHRELDKILHHVKKRGTGHLDAPEYLVYELSKVDHFRERLEFLRFKNKIQINLFEIDQQLRELQTACDEIMTSAPLKHVLETVLAVGNYMNAGTDRGQADGFRVDVLNSLKDIQDSTKQCNLLELVMRIYCLRFEADLDFGCPIKFHLPEPSNMRHAAQVSFEDIQRALRELKDELAVVRNKLESLSKQEGSTLTIALRVTSESFITSALEVLTEEQKILEDTHVQFKKTAAFFSFEGQKASPRDFFQIWASFLHDCKYYWKLAHRNLAKAKFNTDLAIKNQLSSSSLPGFNSLKSTMMKHVASLQQGDKTRASKTQQMQHINSWIQAVGRYTMEMQSEGTSSPTKDSAAYHPGLKQEKKQQNLHSQRYQEHEHGTISPLYKNQQSNPSRNYTKDLSRQTEEGNKEIQNIVNVIPSNSHGHNAVEELQLISSPKPIKATPPNVIKPQAIIHQSPSKSVTPPSTTGLHLAKPLNIIPYQPVISDYSISQKSTGPQYDDNFGFEPFYESLSHYSQTNSALLVGNTDSPPTNIKSFAVVPSPSSPDPEYTQKNNSKFLKSLLKRDPKRLNEESQGNSPALPHKSMSTPFSKVKNTFVQKLSGTGNSKKPSNGSPKGYTDVNQNIATETPPKPAEGLSELETLPYHLPNRDTSNFESSRIDVQMKDPIDYQNVCLPSQTKDFNHVYTASHSELPSSVPTRAIYRDGQESIPSTVSSLQSSRGKSRSNYLVNIQQGYNDSTDQHDKYFKNFKENINVMDRHNNHIHTDNGAGIISQSRKARIRAPIAFGSNTSISEAYRSMEDGKIETVINSDTQPLNPESSDQNEQKSSSSHGGVKASVCDPKWVKTNPVPVYKAKLIPNYENQTKYDPNFESGVRGKAEAIVPMKHTPQISISSDAYREKLQKKSEQHVGGNTNPTPGQTPPGNGVDNLRGSTGQSYTILPSKPIHYHASPITITQGTQRAGTLNDHTHPLTDNNIAEVHGHNYRTQNNPENGETVSVFAQGPVTEGNQAAGQRQIHKTKHVTVLPWQDGRGSKLLSENVPALRSASAHSIQDKSPDSKNRERSIHSAQSSPETHHFKSQSHRSRKDTGGRKITPTSQNNPRNENGEVPQSVTSLIDKFEKGVDVNQGSIGLLNISDKPPSMTSTPVMSRKTHGSSNSQVTASKLDHENGRSHSEGSRRSRSQKETVISRWPKEAHVQKQASRDYSLPNQHSVNLKHHSRAAYFTQSGSHPESHNFSAEPHGYTGDSQQSHGYRGDSQQSHGYRGDSQQSRGYRGDNQHTRNYQQNYDRQSLVKPIPAKRESSHSKNLYHSNKYQMPNNQHDSYIHYINDDKILCQTLGDENSGHKPNHRLQNHQHGSGDRGQDHILKDGDPHQNYKTNEQHSQQAKGSSQNSSNQSSSSSFTPKPDAQIQNTNIQATSIPDQHHFVSCNSDQHLSQKMVTPNYDNLPQYQRWQSPQAGFNSPLTSQQTFNGNAKSITPNIASDGGGHDSNIHYSSKRASSASERPPQAGTKFGCQPGTMAVVKPTIMNI